jgi:YgiT-type zinc finger domain-containing protein
MKCVVCKQAETKPGSTTVTLERSGMTLVYKCVPAEVCPNCGEDYVAESVAEQLLRAAEDTAHVGTEVEIRQFAAGCPDVAVVSDRKRQT